MDQNLVIYDQYAWHQVNERPDSPAVACNRASSWRNSGRLGVLSMDVRYVRRG